MLVTPELNRRHQRFALLTSLLLTIGLAGLSRLLLGPWGWAALLLMPLVYWWLRRRTVRRMRVLQQPFDPEWEAALQSDVSFFRALTPEQQERFRQLVKVFLDEVPITGIRTDVDPRCRALVAASAVIPIFGFRHWEYKRLGEVLIYPNSFDEAYATDDLSERSILGMVCAGHLTGVMILSKPALIAGFQNARDKRNVGIHEFAHLVDQADGDIDGLPPGIPADTVGRWIDWIGQELGGEIQRGHHIDDYAYTNEAEYFAVLTEYFFESPALLQQRSPQIYAMLQEMYRQDTKRLLAGQPRGRRKRYPRNAPCPCGSGKKYKVCCRR